MTTQRILWSIPEWISHTCVNSLTPPGGPPGLGPWEPVIRDGKLFGRDPVYFGGGGTIPFLRMLGERFAGTQFFVTGVLGPRSNAHGPNEFLHIDYATPLTECVSMVLADHGAHSANRPKDRHFAHASDLDNPPK